MIFGLCEFSFFSLFIARFTTIVSSLIFLDWPSQVLTYTFYIVKRRWYWFLSTTWRYYNC